MEKATVMDANSPRAKDGFKRPSKYHRKTTYSGPKASWRSGLWGPRYLCVIVHHWDKMAGDHEKVARTLPNKHRLYAAVRADAPDIDEWYSSETGRPLTAEIVYNRGHKTCYQNGPDGTRGDPTTVSSEHPLHAAQVDKLKSVYLEVVNTIQSGGKITRC